MYFASAIVAVIELFKGSHITSKIMLYLAIAGFVLHSLNIAIRYSIGGHLPITNMHEAASFFSWCIILLFFYLEYRYRVGLLGSFIMPVVFILMLSSSVFPRAIKELSPVLQSSWFSIHISLAFLGDAAFAMAAGVGLMYLVQEHFVKSKHLGDLFHRLPSLQMLDDINYRLISLGFPLLTLAIITGALWAESAWGSYWRWDPKEVWSLITWFIYALVLHVRLTAGWRGKRAAILSIAGFCAVLFTFFGVNLLLKGLHTFI
ncbi:MAG TPA: c-type cytochrome biogenesis protein CcsB [Nitrospirae bacterium]|nr:c-type cytochrome biogenesis protein CcsB [Nitrospirota bacterium]HDO23357.1 c-type cytochrome biogenesis protein CcsB [Nitrospirota bacterium]HDZ89002.1 c-type cytochrome biogenesis protein CcsB [Nitrospirota bacterium]